MKRLTTLFSLLLFAAVSAAAQVTISFELDPGSILPGTSSTITATVSNAGREAVVIRNGIALEVVDPNGTKFMADQQDVSDTPEYLPIPHEMLTNDPATDITRFTLGAGQTLRFEIPFFYGTTFFNDRRISFPGRYKLRAGMLTLAGSEIWSDQQILEVREPAGIDRAVWMRMLEIGKGRGWSWRDWNTTRFADEVWEKFRESSYTPYAISPGNYMKPSWTARRDIGLKGPQRDPILLDEAQRSYAPFAQALDRRDHAGARRAIDYTKALYENLLASTESQYIRVIATREYEGLPSPQRVNEIIRSLEEAEKNRPSVKIIPSVNCISKLTSGLWIAWFDYESPLSYELWLGSNKGSNKFEPQPHERGQPEIFKPGKNERAFSITFDGEPVTWFLRGEKATASKSSSITCN